MTAMRDFCGAGGQCSYHADGGDDDKCVGTCDAVNCASPGVWEITESPAVLHVKDWPIRLCGAHLRLAAFNPSSPGFRVD